MCVPLEELKEESKILSGRTLLNRNNKTNRINKTLDTIYERINELSGVDAFGWGYSLFKKTKAILGTLITGKTRF